MNSYPTNLTFRRARDADLSEMARIHSSAYPGANMTLEQRLNGFRNNPRTSLENYWVCTKGNQVVGMFVLYDFVMFRLNQSINVGGIGSVAVSPEARRDRIAFYMMKKAVEIMEQNSTPLSILYPFKHSFYGKLGWGNVIRVNLFKLSPENLSNFPERENVTVVSTTELRDEVMASYNKFAKRNNGMLQRSEMLWNEHVFKNAECYAYIDPKSKHAEGYLTFRYRPHPSDVSFLSCDLEVWDFIYNSTKAFRGLISFLSSQREQVKTIYFPDQIGMPMEYLLSEPIAPKGFRNWIGGAEVGSIGSSQMGRIVSLKRTLKGINRWNDASGEITIQVNDTLNEANNEAITISLDNGKLDFVKGKTASVTMKCEISTFASLVWGSLNISDALLFGLVELDGKGDASFLKNMFTTQRPLCLDAF